MPLPCKVQPMQDTPSYDIKSASLSLVAFLLKTTNTSQLQADLTRRLGETPGFFDHDPVVIDLSQLDDPQADVDLPTVCMLLRSHQLLPVAVRGAQPHHLPSAQAAGLFQAQDLSVQAPTRTETVVQEVIREVEVVREVPAASGSAMVVDKPLRSGQHVYARGRDLVVLAMVNPGAEIMADGHIHVYAPLRGKAIAGARGDESARIFTSCLEAELISIAGTYRTSDTPLPADVAGKAAQITLQGEKLVMQRL
jgi:septum site-determining protein MinC